MNVQVVPVLQVCFLYDEVAFHFLCMTQAKMVHFDNNALGNPVVPDVKLICNS